MWVHVCVQLCEGCVCMCVPRGVVVITVNFVLLERANLMSSTAIGSLLWGLACKFWPLSPLTLEVFWVQVCTQTHTLLFGVVTA